MRNMSGEVAEARLRDAIEQAGPGHRMTLYPVVEGMEVRIKAADGSLVDGVVILWDDWLDHVRPALLAVEERGEVPPAVGGTV